MPCYDMLCIYFCLILNVCDVLMQNAWFSFSFLFFSFFFISFSFRFFCQSFSKSLLKIFQPNTLFFSIHCETNGIFFKNETFFSKIDFFSFPSQPFLVLHWLYLTYIFSRFFSQFSESSYISWVHDASFFKILITFVFKNFPPVIWIFYLIDLLLSCKLNKILSALKIRCKRDINKEIWFYLLKQRVQQLWKSKRDPTINMLTIVSQNFQSVIRSSLWLTSLVFLKILRLPLSLCLIKLSVSRILLTHFSTSPFKSPIST